MEAKAIYLDKVDSTNRYLLEYQPTEGEDATICVADFQTAGRGCGSNSWESERGKNLLFSLLIHPTDIEAREQFHISMAISLAICDAMQSYGMKDVSVKWPNDIYWKDKKICGILIEHTIMDNTITQSIAGIGLNINQKQFISDAPNPVSLSQITGQEYNLETILDQIIEQFNALKPLLNEPEKLKQLYFASLYRKECFYPYCADNETFEAQIVDVADNGLITLQLRNGTKRQFAFKEITYLFNI